MITNYCEPISLKDLLTYDLFDLTNSKRIFQRQK